MKRYVKELALDMIARSKGMQKEYRYRYICEIKQIVAYTEQGLITDFEAVTTLVNLPDKLFG